MATAGNAEVPVAGAAVDAGLLAGAVADDRIDRGDNESISGVGARSDGAPQRTLDAAPHIDGAGARGSCPPWRAVTVVATRSDLDDSSGDRRHGGTWAMLRRRKVVQWGIAYAAGAWGLLQGLEYVIATFHWPAMLQQLATLALLAGLPIVLVIAWYHGDRGQQKVTATEFIILTLLFLLGGGIFWLYEPATEPDVRASSRRPAGDPEPPANSIAVLPFVNMSNDPANAYFSDGISEEILNSLAQVPDLHVAARTSSFAFKGQPVEISDIAQELRVRMVLEGSVRRQGERVRITAQLIDARRGYHVWSQTYDRELSDIFAIQDEIARAIADSLQVKLAAPAVSGPGKSTKADLAAYDLYLQGLSLWQARGQENLDQAERLFEQAVAIDPSFAKAWAGIALVETLRPDWFGTPNAVAYPRARDTAERALALDPALPEAYAALGNTAFNEGRPGTARELFERALTIAPSYATGWQWYGWGLATTGSAEDALPISRRAVELDPKSWIVRQDLAVTLYLLQRYEEMEQLCEEILVDAVDPLTCRSLVFDGRMARKDYAGARKELRLAAALRGTASIEFAELLMDAVEGRADVDEVAARLLPMADGFYDRTTVSPLSDVDSTLWFIAVGRPADAVARLRRMATNLPNVARATVVDPALDVIRCRSDFRAVVTQLAIEDSRARRCSPTQGS